MSKRHPKKRQTPLDKEVARDVDGYLASKSQDQDADYVRRGRSFGVLPESELVAQFQSAFRGWVDNVQNAASRNLYNDLESELRLRSIDPPYDEDARKRLVDLVTARLKEIRSDPARFREFGEDVVQDVEEFAAKRDKPKN